MNDVITRKVLQRGEMWDKDTRIAADAQITWPAQPLDVSYDHDWAALPIGTAELAEADCAIYAGLTLTEALPERARLAPAGLMRYQWTADGICEITKIELISLGIVLD